MTGLDLNLPPLTEENEEPFIGQVFLSQEEAYIFYNNYAKRMCFVVRKDRSDTRNGKTIRRDFNCHREGKGLIKVVDPSKEQRNKLSARCHCKAHMRITLKRAFDIFSEEWHVTKFVKEHNHELLTPTEMCFLPAFRSIGPTEESEILLYKKAGLSVRQIIRLMELQRNLKHGELPFLEKDVHNLFAKVKKLIGGNDAKNLIEYMKFLKKQNMMFQYAYTVDDENRLENLFWCHPQSFSNILDTTYKVNLYDMPCAIFVGVDNYGKSVCFGFALLRNETVATFKWLMKTFVDIMKKQPKTILTDQDPSMSQAIASEMPTTKHSFCIWHITSKFSSWLQAVLRHDYHNWCADFYKLYKLISPEFDHDWTLKVERYKLHTNKHVQGMITTGRSESINAFVKKFVSAHTSLEDFVKQVANAIEEISKGRSQNKMLAKFRPTPLRKKSSLEEQVFRVLTPFAFSMFQEEFGRVGQYSVVHTEGNDFILKYFEGENTRTHKVFWDGYKALCTCKNFEFWGILCRHILRVSLHKNCFNIPLCYLPLRWSHDAVQSAIEMQTGSMMDEQSLLDQTLVDSNILCPPKSKTKGRPTLKRLRSGKESSQKQTKCCSVCKKPGHTKPTSPNKENIGRIDMVNEGTSNSSQKRGKKTASDLGLNPIFCLKF